MKPVWLRKWYLDAVADDGRAFILYWASLRLGPVSLGVASVLEAVPGREPRTRTSVSGCEEPRESGGVVTFENDSFACRGGWSGRCPAVERELLAGPDGAIRWRCIAPCAEVDLEAGGERLRGLGYVEVMEMSIAPWKVPIQELRWGRAVGAAEGGRGIGSVVWIDWRGPVMRTDVFLDGAAASARVGDDRVEGEAFELGLMRDRTLRDGPIGTTALAGIPGISSWAPARFLGTLETKWISRAAFAGAGGRAWNGWAIHEVVRFPGPSP